VSNNNISVSTEKSFGVVFSIVFLLVALHPLINSEEIHLWAITVSVIFLFLAYVIPNVLSIPNRLWFKFGMLLSSIISPIVMGLVYITTVLPTGLIMRLLGKDLLRQKLDKKAQTYWIERSGPIGSMKNQF
jgi:ABC-type Fe3+ transport system permease subunit